MRSTHRISQMGTGRKAGKLTRKELDFECEWKCVTVLTKRDPYVYCSQHSITRKSLTDGSSSIRTDIIVTSSERYAP